MASPTATDPPTISPRADDRAGASRTCASSIDELLGVRARSRPSPRRRPSPCREAQAPHSAADARAERDEQVQPVVRLLLRVRRGQDRRGVDQAAFHERGDGEAERGLHVQRVGRFAEREPDVLRRRDAAELQDASSRRWPTRRKGSRARQAGQRQSDDERDAAARRSDRLDGGRTTSASPCRSTARASSRTSIACSRTAWAATTSSCRGSRCCSPGTTAPRRRACHAHRDRISTSRRSTSICTRRSASGRSASRR